MAIEDSKKHERREDIKAIAEKYRTNNGGIDLSALRKNDERIYSRISYNFGSIENFLLEMGDGEAMAAGTSINRNVVRNKMCWDYFNYLREVKKMTYEDIGNEYGVSRMYMSKLFRELERTFGGDTTNDDNDGKAVDTEKQKGGSTLGK